MILAIETKLPRNTFQGMMLLVVTYMMFTVLDTTSKYLSQFLHPIQIAWFRFVAQMIIVSIFLRFSDYHHYWRTTKLWGQMLRSLLVVGVTIANFMAIQTLQLDVTSTIFFTVPILVTLLSVIVLKEKIAWRRGIAICCGFIGVVIIINPQSASYHPMMFLQLGGSLCFAVYLILTRWLAHHDSVVTQLAYMPIVGSLVLLPPALMVWQPVLSSANALWLLSLLGLTGLTAAIGHWCMVKASTLMEAPLVAASSYQQIFYMALAGWLVFGDIPKLSVIIGAPLIIAAGMVIAYREYRLQRRHAVL